MKNEKEIILLPYMVSDKDNWIKFEAYTVIDNKLYIASEFIDTSKNSPIYKRLTEQVKEKINSDKYDCIFPKL